MSSRSGRRSGPEATAAVTHPADDGGDRGGLGRPEQVPHAWMPGWPRGLACPPSTSGQPVTTVTAAAIQATARTGTRAAVQDPGGRPGDQDDGQRQPLGGRVQVPRPQPLPRRPGDRPRPVIRVVVLRVPRDRARPLRLPPGQSQVILSSRRAPAPGIPRRRDTGWSAALAGHPAAVVGHQAAVGGELARQLVVVGELVRAPDMVSRGVRGGVGDVVQRGQALRVDADPRSGRSRTARSAPRRRRPSR